MARYLPLRKTRHIRLLNLELSPSSEETLGTLTVKSLDDPELQTVYRYDALSYVWGVANSDHKVILNGWSCSVRKNLHSFFLCYRHDDSSPYIWIDALCIDQDSISERNSQVALIAEIYQRAQNVIVWLGPADPHSDIVMNVIESTLDQTRALTQLEEHTIMQVGDAIVELMSREYWSRTWIIQEFLLGKNLIISCGRRRLSGVAAEVAFSNLASLDRTKWLKGTRAVAGLGLLDQRAHRFRKSPLLDLIVRNRTSLCSIPHDKVFALLGLASDCTPTKSLQVDYAMPLKRLFSDVLAFCDVHGKDVFRYAYFLRHVLGINVLETSSPQLMLSGTSLAQSSPSGTKFHQAGKSIPQNALILNAHGFKTGKIVTSTQLLTDGRHLANRPETTFGQSNLEAAIQFLQREQLNQTETDPAGVGRPNLMTGPSRDDLCRLHTEAKLLQSVSDRSFPVSNVDSGPPLLTPPHFAVAEILFSGRVSKAFVAGITYGHCSKGDVVVQLPGFDIAFTMTANRPARITGRAIFANLGSSSPNADHITFEEFKYDFIQSPSDCRVPQGSVNLRLTTDELLELVR
ncbi:hypothetical protein GJ744_007972 [Endocarpon pusillum]|uniref:Heterokaryon incompatibility domain-containing protein n=1 Tax=Endocarpon pusillum TaxID=364733 RepID=A0A8H7A7G8_9EURO|nr:hypothetical protein GJ744_007972 [Endocarpon pusillum]